MGFICSNCSTRQKAKHWHFNKQRLENMGNLWRAVKGDRKICFYCFDLSEPFQRIELDGYHIDKADFLTIKEYRGQGKYTALIRETMYYLKKKGYLQCIIRTFEDNLASRSVIQKLNFIPIVT